MIKYFVLALLVMLVAAAFFVRIRPISAEAHHVLPISVATKGENGRFTATAGGDMDAVKSDLALTATAEALKEKIEATPRTFLLAGSLEEGFATYVTRSKLWGFPDITNIQLTATPSGTQVEMAGRLVYGELDMGVNEKRLRKWLAGLDG